MNGLNLLISAGEASGDLLGARLLRALRAREPGCAIVISHMAENDASARVIEKLGFRPIGEKRTYYLARASEVRSLTYLYPQNDPQDAAAG